MFLLCVLLFSPSLLVEVRPKFPEQFKVFQASGTIERSSCAISLKLATCFCISLPSAPADGAHLGKVPQLGGDCG